ncbi:hypothetical protein Isop_0062 [Isosphaera pallida ATCC 43644]|uniref:Uncharacterized protein n=1 Tax=Isosphaera pallida (strain ATCC 43644 / DSM 9630 / IS1B) TaxID=575540 RepID=E8R5B8_ISOPI|nr:hypothetical protein [Isosphaera pallida]ADV60659.1 hypothetical protein Isop_0062 [Isosphaera pallida ATCC 43644]
MNPYLSASTNPDPDNNAEKSKCSWLLAVDAGLRLGMAYFEEPGHVVWCRSHHLGSRHALRNAIGSILAGLPQAGRLVVEGGGPLVELWTGEAQRRGWAVLVVAAERWRADLLVPRDRSDARRAKAAALARAREMLRNSPRAANPTHLRHDAAEAVLLGHWAWNHADLFINPSRRETLPNVAPPKPTARRRMPRRGHDEGPDVLKCD